MDELIKLSDNINHITTNWDNMVNEFILINEPLFIDTVHEQLTQGKGGDGSTLYAYQSPEYAEYKKAIGSISSPIADLKVTGDFYEGMKMKSDFSIASSDWKNDALVKKYGADIMEISDESMEKLIKSQLLPNFLAYISNLMGL